MIEKFDIDNLTKSAYYVGRLEKKIVDLLGINLAEMDILFSKDKIEYTKKHINDFNDYESFKKHVEATPDIIAEPDYVGVHPNGQSIEFIKEIDEITLVAVRIKPVGILWVKSVFPITRSKLNSYLKSGTLKKLK